MRTFMVLSMLAIMPGVEFSQPVQAVFAFEAADVHRSAQAMNPFTYVSGGVLRGERYELHKATMLDLIRLAFNLEPESIVGGPDWLEFDRFDISARAVATSSPGQVRLMLQSLLATRFHLETHKDMRLATAFALAVGKTKPKLKESDGTEKAECRYPPETGGSFWTVYVCRNITMASFAENLRSIG